MNFLFPSTYAELRDHHFLDRYKVSTKNQVSKMDERLWLMRIHQLDEGFNQLDTIIQDPQYFDFFYHLIEYKFPPIQALRSASKPKSPTSTH